MPPLLHPANAAFSCHTDNRFIYFFEKKSFRPNLNRPFPPIFPTMVLTSHLLKCVWLDHLISLTCQLKTCQFFTWADEEGRVPQEEKGGQYSHFDASNSKGRTLVGHILHIYMRCNNLYISGGFHVCFWEDMNLFNASNSRWWEG